MKNTMPRIILAAMSSGSGKTMLTCSIMNLFRRHGLKVAGFKCGPDYIDPMFHRTVPGAESGNLDTFFTDGDTVRYLLSRKAENADITVTEGVMGYYDGLGGKSDTASTYDIARTTLTPVILIADVKKAGDTLVEQIRDTLNYRKDNNIRGIILNRAASEDYEKLKALTEEETKIIVLGYLPETDEINVPSRHLGLVAPGELDKFRQSTDKVSDILENTLDVKKLYAIAKDAPYIEGKKPHVPKLNGRVRIAVAKDEAFSFYYTENKELAQQMGAEIIYFSPLHDRALPPDADGIILGGGYPELYAKKLSENKPLIESLRKALSNGIPCYAECGGFMYLHESTEGTDGKIYSMLGVLPGNVFRTEKLCRFGYTQITALRGGVMCRRGESIRAHEFHYWDCENTGSDFKSRKPLSSKEYSCMVHTENMLAGFLHIYFYNNVNMLYNFLEAGLRYRIKRESSRHWDCLAKPIDSLGIFEKCITKICSLQKNHEYCDIRKKAVVVMCGDHGVVEEGVTQTSSSVTKNVSESIAKGEASVSYMAKRAGADVYVIDMGTDCERYENKELCEGLVIDRKIARGTKNIRKESAMSTEECRKAMETGTEIVRELKDRGYRLIAAGEMGIGNTTVSSVLGGILLDRSAEDITGRGAGLSDEALEKKIKVVADSIQRIKDKHPDSVTDILAEGGGFEIAGLAGVFLGGALYGIPVITDGVITGISALAAYLIDSRVKDITIASHVSAEPLGEYILSYMGLDAPIRASMRSGEGTGAVMLMPLLDMTSDICNSMRSFESSGIEPYKRF